MARQGPRFGEGKGLNRVTADLDEDVVRGQARDVDKIKKGMSPSGKSALERRAAQEAAGRAITRTLSRAAPAAAALEAGYSAGRALDEKTGVGRKMVDKAIGPAIDQMAVKQGDRVKLSAGAKERIEDEEKSEIKRETRRSPSTGIETSDKEKSSSTRKYSSAPPSRKASGVREGANSGIDDDTRARALKFAKDNNPEREVEDEEPAFKKGGSVRGWGMARGARKAKMR